MNGKRNWNAFTIIGIVYSAIGIIFCLIGLGLILVPSDPEAGIVGISFAPIGLVFLVLGIVFLVMEKRRQRREQALVASGRYIWGEVVDEVPNVNVRVNGRFPYMLLVRYTDGRGTSHLFKSGNLKTFRDPQLIGRKVKVYYENDTFRRYFVDAEPILPKVIEH